MDKDDIRKKLEKVRLSYIASLDDKREEIDQHWRKLKENWDNETYDNLYLIVHSLAGSAETFGFPELTQRSRSIVDLFKQANSRPFDNDTNQEVDTNILELLNMLTIVSRHHSE